MPDSARFAVIFVSQRSVHDEEGYAKMAERMEELVRGQDGYIGMHSVRGNDGKGITVSYWTSEEAIANWRRQLEHREAQKIGPIRWYDGYEIVVSRIERQSQFGELNRRP